LKKILIIVSILFLSACGSGVDVKADNKQRFTDDYDSYLRIVKDKETGCKYIILHYRNDDLGITPLLNSEGKPICSLTGDY
jgi:protein involved in sex pheromone biosynthesis